MSLLIGMVGKIVIRGIGSWLLVVGAVGAAEFSFLAGVVGVVVL